MTLTAKQHAARDGKITGSFLSPLCAGKTDVILDKWKELVGDPSWRPADLSDVWPVQFGSFVEPFALDWHERRTGHALTRRGEVVAHPSRPNVCATLDAWRAFDNSVLDCKATSGFNDLDEQLKYHSPQLLCQRECTGAAYAYLLVVHGGAEPVELQAHFPEEWAAQVWAAVDQFWDCVFTLRPPVEIPRVPPPPDRWVQISLDEAAERARYNWAAEMVEQLDIGERTEAAARQHDEAKAAIKRLLPDDCGRLEHGGRLIKRARNRAVTVKWRQP